MNSITRVSFSGHRPEKLMKPFDENSEYIIAIKKKLKALIKDAIDNGCNIFYCGMAKGIDIIAGEIVAQFIAQGYDIKLLAVIPYIDYAKHWDKEWKIRYDALIKCASRYMYIDKQYYKDSYLKRNRYLIENSDMLIAVRKGKEHSGTSYTINYAQKLGLKIKLIEL